MLIYHSGFNGGETEKFVDHGPLSTRFDEAVCKGLPSVLMRLRFSWYVAPLHLDDESGVSHHGQEVSVELSTLCQALCWVLVRRPPSHRAYGQAVWRGKGAR